MEMNSFILGNATATTTMLMGILIGYRMAIRKSPIAGPVEMWSNLKAFVEPKPEEKQAESKKTVPPQLKF